MSGEGTSASVLVVEDDRAIGEGLVRDLNAHGYSVKWARSGREGLELAASSPPEAILLDLGLPDLDGIHVCRSFRRTLPDVPIVILTARDTEVDTVVGLDAGASDYVTKPFSVHVLLARLRAHLRQATPRESQDLVFGDLRIDVGGFRAFLGPDELPLRPKELALLLRLATSAGRILSRDQLLHDVWDVGWDTETKTLEVHMHALRGKLGPRPDGRPWITTVRSYGYRFEA